MDIPIEVRNQAALAQLGEFRQAFDPNKRWRQIIASGVLTLMLGGIFALVITTSIANNPDDPGNWAVVVLCVILTAPWPVLMIWMMSQSPVFSAKARQRRFYLYEQGYVHVTRQGLQSYRWDKVQSVFQSIVTTRSHGVKTGTNYTYSLAFTDGRRIKLNTLSAEMSQLGPVLMDEIAKVQLPKALNYLRTGQAIAFGDFSLSSRGIAAKRKAEVPWSAIDGVRLADGYVRVSQAGKWLPFSSTAAAKIPNLYTFLMLAEHHVAAAHGQRVSPA